MMGGYRPVAPIGRGRTAEVLLVLADAGGRARKTVVLKRIRPDLTGDAEVLALFRHECWVASRLKHPNVVQVFGLVEEGQQLAIAMEYLHGQPLAAVLNRLGGPGELARPLCLRVIIDVLAGLHHAHQLRSHHGSLLGVVHRDVNPENIFVTYSGQVKVMDFGGAQTAMATVVTGPGALKGKLSYVAPECIRGGVVDLRADIFAVGIMLWELLAGRRMWRGMGEVQIIRHLAARMPMPGLPNRSARWGALDAICARALAINPEARYETASEFENDLQQALEGSASSQARDLGRVVSEAFSDERIEREALIAGAVDGGRPAEPRRAWATEIDRLSPTIDGFFDETVVQVWEPPQTERPPPPRRSRGHRASVAIAGAISLAAVLVLVVVVAWRAPGRAEVTAQPVFPKESCAPLVPDEDPSPRTASVAASRWGQRSLRPAADARGSQARGHVTPADDPRLDTQGPRSVRVLDESDPFK